MKRYLIIAAALALISHGALAQRINSTPFNGTINSSSSTALQVVPVGTTSQALVIDTSTANAVTGVNIAAKATGGVTTITCTDGGSANASCNYTGSGSGTVNVGPAGGGTAGMSVNGGQRISATTTAVKIGPPIIGSGNTRFTASSCGASNPIGGSWIGCFNTTTTGTCSQTITPNGASGSSATNGFLCEAWDITAGHLATGTPTAPLSTTTGSFNILTTSGDQVCFVCHGM